MNYNTINYNYINLMTQAEQATTRQEAIEYINQATKLMETMNYIKQQERQDSKY